MVNAFGEEIITVRFRYLGLPALDGARYNEKDNPVTWALAGLMRVPKEERAKLKAESLRRVQRAKQDRTK